MKFSPKLFLGCCVVFWIFDLLFVKVLSERKQISYHSKAPDHIRPEDRIYNWQVYQNEMEPRTALLCPKGLFLSKIMYKVYKNKGKDAGPADKHADIHEQEEDVHVIHLTNHIEAIFKERLAGLVQESLEHGGIRELVEQDDNPDNSPCDIGNVVTNRNFVCRNMTHLHDGSLLDCDTYKVMVSDFMQGRCMTTVTDRDNTTAMYSKLKKYYSANQMNNTSSEENIKDEGRVWAGNKHPFGPCPTLLYCLGHQACLFHYSNKFCQNDAFPGSRKQMKVRFTCHDDLHNDNIKSVTLRFLTEKLDLVELEDLSSLEEYHLNVLTWPISISSSKAVFLKYKTKLKHLVPPEKELIDEEEIFEIGCASVESALETGYSGNCNPIEVNSHRDSDLLWSTLARTTTSECREEITQMFCAFRYNKQGQCFPPFVQNISKDEHDGSASWSFKAFPENGLRFSDEQYMKIFENPLMSLIPSRLAFNILAHNTPDLVLELLSQLYRPEHYFIIVMDVSVEESRQKLMQLISDVYPGNDNILVLPAERSFASSWGSFNIVRAELEGYEELLRMGVWDFTINLSGTCLALRSVDDLAISLAPYRGLSFIRTFDMGHSFDLRNFERILQTWHSCDKHVYNTLLHRGTPAADLGIYSQNNFQILSRELAELLVSRKSQPIQLQWMHFYQMSTFVPDEMYFRTMLMHSPLREKNLEVRFYHMKRFHGDNDEHLCRHSEEVDACGQGPGTYGKGDIEELMRESKQFFLARKFSTDTQEETRQTILRYQQEDGYHQRHVKQFPPVVEKALLRDAIERLQTVGQISGPVTDLRVTRLQIVPLHKTSDPCCQAVVRHFIQFSQHFKIIMHFTLTLQNGSSTSAVASVALNPEYLSQCYPSGHIRAIQVGTRLMPNNRDSKSSEDLLPVQPLSVVNSAHTENIYLRFLLERSTQGMTETQCRQTENVKNPNHLIFAEWELPESINRRNDHEFRSGLFGRRPRPPKVHVIPFRIVLYDPNGNVRMTDMRKVERKSFGERNKDRKEMINVTDVTVTVKSGTLYPGEWNIHITEIDQENAFVYKQKIVVLDENFSSIMSKGNRCGLYCVEEVALQTHLHSDMYYVKKLKIPLDTNRTQAPAISSQTCTREENQMNNTTWGVAYEYSKVVLDLVITTVSASLILRR